MSNTEVPPFAEAVDSFRAFLAREGHATEIQWVFREDIIHRWPKCYVKVPLKCEVASIERLYDDGILRGLGITLNMFCLLDGLPCCYVWLPKDKKVANYRMLNRCLKLSIPTESGCPTAIPIRSRLRWMWLKWREHRDRRVNWADEIPSASESRTVRPDASI